MTENESIKTVSDGITFLSTGRYYDGINRWIAHKLKDGDNDAIDYAARQISKAVTTKCGSRSNPRTSWQSRTDHAVGKGYLVIYSPPYR